MLSPDLISDKPARPKKVWKTSGLGPGPWGRATRQPCSATNHAHRSHVSFFKYLDVSPAEIWNICNHWQIYKPTSQQHGTIWNTMAQSSNSTRFLHPRGTSPGRSAMPPSCNITSMSPPCDSAGSPMVASLSPGYPAYALIETLIPALQPDLTAVLILCKCDEVSLPKVKHETNSMSASTCQHPQDFWWLQAENEHLDPFAFGLNDPSWHKAVGQNWVLPNTSSLTRYILYIQ